MDELLLIMQNINVTQFDVNTNHWVHIIHTINPHDFYVRPTKYRTFIEKLELTKPIHKPWSVEVHNIVIYNIDHTGTQPKYARGKICYAENADTFHIFAVDYGYYHQSVPIDLIWECKEALSDIPPLALSCKLANCAPLGGKDWSKETIDAFKFYVKDERAKMIILDKTYDKLLVELINSNPNDIATLMALTGYSTWGYVHNAISSVPTYKPQKIFLTFKNLNMNETLHVRVQSGKSLSAFYVAEVNDYRNYMQEYSTMTYCTKREPKLSDGFTLKRPVCVKNDIGDYERAIINEITVNHTKAKVKLVDWGKEEEAHINNMRPIPEQFLKMPVIAIYCSVDEKQLWDNSLHSFLYPGFEFLIQIKKLGKEFESPNIVKIIPLQGNSSKTTK